MGRRGRFSESPPPPHLFQRLKSEGDVPDVILSGYANSEIQGFSPAGPDRETRACREMSPYCNYVFVSRSFYGVHVFPEVTGPHAPGCHIGPRYLVENINLTGQKLKCGSRALRNSRQKFFPPISRISPLYNTDPSAYDGHIPQRCFQAIIEMLSL